MINKNRDDFLESTKRKLAMRAGFLCSLRSCRKLTIGPSDESPTSVVNSGHAAHIHAAAPNGRRYLEAMTPEDRSDISNGIWLCATHAGIIDRDDTEYTADSLREEKRQHEGFVKYIHERLGATVHTMESRPGDELPIIEFWRENFDSKELIQEMEIRHEFYHGILIKEDFILKCMNFLEQIAPILEGIPFCSPIKLSFETYIYVLQDFISLIDESDPYNNDSKYLPLVDRAHEKGDFMYIVATSYDDSSGLHPADQIAITQNVMYIVMNWVILSSNDLIKTINNSRILNENIPYIAERGKVAQFPTEPYPRIKKIREFITTNYIAFKNGR